MKGIIVEIRKNKAAALLEDGTVRMLPSGNHKIGEEIRMSEKETKNRTWGLPRVAAIAAAVVVLLAGGGGYAYATPYSEVSLDVNPSIEYVLNVFDQVIEVNALNEDGTEILTDEVTDEIVGESIDEAITDTLDAIASEGILTDEVEDAIILGTTCKDMEHAEELADRLRTMTLEKLKNNGLDTAVMAITMTQEERQLALESGLSIGKYFAVEHIRTAMGLGEDATFQYQDYAEMTIRELKNLAEENGVPMEGSGSMGEPSGTPQGNGIKNPDGTGIQGTQSNTEDPVSTQTQSNVGGNANTEASNGRK